MKEETIKRLQTTPFEKIKVKDFKGVPLETMQAIFATVDIPTAERRIAEMITIDIETKRNSYQKNNTEERKIEQMLLDFRETIRQRIDVIMSQYRKIEQIVMKIRQKEQIAKIVKKYQQKSEESEKIRTSRGKKQVDVNENILNTRTQVTMNQLVGVLYSYQVFLAMLDNPHDNTVSGMCLRTKREGVPTEDATSGA